MKKCLIIQNPNSGDGNSNNLMDLLKEKLNERFDSVSHLQTNEENDGFEFAKKASENGFDSIIIVGGDGTYNEVINAISSLEYRPKLYLLPGGTNNTFNKLIGGSGDLKESIDNLNFDNTIKVDVGKCNDKYFSYYVSFGKLIEATTSTSSKEKKLLGPLAYVKNIAKALPNDETVEVEVSSDEFTYRGGASLLYVMLTDKIGDKDISSQLNTINDGKATVFILTNEKMLSKAHAMADLLKGTFDKNENIKSFTTSRVNIKSLDNKKVELDLDGDVYGNLPCQIEILKEHIEIYLP